jgi:hypothetical protein
MGDWRMQGQAVRRRAGGPASHYESTGVGARVSLPTPEEALAGMARVGSPRVPMGTSAIMEFINAKIIPPFKGTLMPKTGNAKGDAGYPEATKANRENVDFRAENSGAAFRINAFVPPTTSPEATATQANGRIVPPILDRYATFDDGMDGAYKGY